MNGLILIGFFAAVAIIVAAAKKNPQGLVEYDVDAEDIREGVKNGWYTCALMTKDDMPAVILSGKMTNGEDFQGVYTISPDDWNALQKEGYKVADPHWLLV